MYLEVGQPSKHSVGVISHGTPTLHGFLTGTSSLCCAVQERRLKDLIKKHSEFISYPISLWTEKTVEKVRRRAVLRCAVLCSAMLCCAVRCYGPGMCWAAELRRQ